MENNNLVGSTLGKVTFSRHLKKLKTTQFIDQNQNLDKVKSFSYVSKLANKRHKQ